MSTSTRLLTRALAAASLSRFSLVSLDGHSQRYSTQVTKGKAAKRRKAKNKKRTTKH